MKIRKRPERCEMIRYFLYLVLMNMIVNVIVFVPRILIDERYDGAVMAVMIGIPLSVLFLYFYSNALLKFPAKGLPEIISEHTAKWFSIPFLLMMAALWIYAGLFILLAFVDVTMRFVNPEMNEMIIASVFLAVVGIGVLLKTEKVLFTLEIVLISIIPLISLIFIKAYTNPYLNWDAIRVVLTHYKELPSLSSLGAISFTLYGFYNIAIFNRVFAGKIKKINIWWTLLILAGGYINAFTSVFIPIGFNGTNGVGDFIYHSRFHADGIWVRRTGRIHYAAAVYRSIADHGNHPLACRDEAFDKRSARAERLEKKISPLC